MAAQYKLSKSTNDQFYFVLTAENNEPILKSEMYTTKSAALNGIESVKTNSPDDARYVRLTSANGQFYFNLRAANNQVIGSSEMYKAERSRENGIEAVKRVGPVATLSESA